MLFLDGAGYLCRLSHSTWSKSIALVVVGWCTHKFKAISSFCSSYFSYLLISLPSGGPIITYAESSSGIQCLPHSFNVEID